eukprot:scaffold647925_cov34-Prasinocladus_malaysianus.AAC.1
MAAEHWRQSLRPHGKLRFIYYLNKQCMRLALVWDPQPERAPKAGAALEEDDEDEDSEEDRVRSSSKGGVTGDEEDDADEDKNRQFVACRPLAAAVSNECHTAKAGKAGSSGPEEGTQQKVRRAG